MERSLGYVKLLLFIGWLVAYWFCRCREHEPRATGRSERGVLGTVSRGVGTSHQREAVPCSCMTGSLLLLSAFILKVPREEPSGISAPVTTWARWAMSCRQQRMLIWGVTLSVQLWAVLCHFCFLGVQVWVWQTTLGGQVGKGPRYGSGRTYV